MLVIRMIFPRQRRSTMKSTTCLTLQWRLLARVTRPCLSSASHFFGLRINPSCSEIFNLRRISFLNSGTDKFLGRLGKIEGLFISNPKEDVAYILSSLSLFWVKRAGWMLQPGFEYLSARPPGNLLGGHRVVFCIAWLVPHVGTIVFLRNLDICGV